MIYSAETQTEGKLSSFLQDQRIKAALPFLSGKILDFGSGNGSLARYFESAQYVGVDINPSAVEIAKRRFPNYPFFQNQEFRYPPHSFNTVASLAVVEHLVNPNEWFEWINLQLKETGLLIITTPHPSYRELHELGAKVGIFSQTAAREHKVFVDHHTINNIASDTGFQLLISSRFLGGANQLFVLKKHG